MRGMKVKWMGCERNKSSTSFRVANFAHWMSSYLQPKVGTQNIEHEINVYLFLMLKG
jgi:hypothetical protein